MLAQCGLLLLVASTLALTAEETACDGSIACLARLRAQGRLAHAKRSSRKTPTSSLNVSLHVIAGHDSPPGGFSP